MRFPPLPVAISVGVHATIVGAMVYWGVGAISMPQAQEPAEPIIIRWVARSELESPQQPAELRQQPLQARSFEENALVELPELLSDSSVASGLASHLDSETTPTTAAATRRAAAASAPALQLPTASQPQPQRPAHTPRRARPPAMAASSTPGEVSAQLRHDVVIEYPAECRRRHHEGTVVLLLNIDVEGNVTGAEVTEGASCRHMNKAALAMAKTLRYQPARRQGIPVASRLRQSILFQLDAETRVTAP